VLIAMPVEPLAAAAKLYLIKVVIDGVLHRQQTALLPWIAVAYLACSVVGGVAGFIEDYLSTWIGGRVVLALRSDLYQYLQGLSLSFYNRRRVGDLVARLTGDVATIETLLVSGVGEIVTYALRLVLYLAMLVYLSWSLSLVVLLAAPVMFLIALAFMRRIQSAARQVRAELGDVSAVANESLSGIVAVKAFGREDFEQERFDGEAASTFRATVQARTLKASFGPLMDLIVTASTVAVICLGTAQYLDGQLSVGTLVAFLAYLGSVHAPLRGLAKRSNTIQAAAAGADRVFDIFDLDPSVCEPRGGLALRRATGHVVFDRVAFRYEGGRPVLDDSTIEVRPGETVALVGESGIGKTTLVSLLLRFYAPQRGRILLDGIDLATIEPASLRNLIAVVPQEPFLFSASIRENIRYGRLDASDEQVEAAARAAFADPFIRALPDGYDTAVGQRGTTLSGGQRQRVAIARALLRDAPILVLDEATAALDGASEEAVQAALERLLVGRTAIVIAHRFSTIRRADRIVVLDQGAVAGAGGHQELLATCATYRRLYARAG
jgi:ABC-type multidrug transport system fused ATPase/permease subunit